MSQNNSTDVRIFRAPSMQAALELVRKEMGADAVILHTRELSHPRWQWWKKQDEKVEITAGTGVNVRSPRVIVSPPRPSVAARTTHGNGSASPSDTSSQTGSTGRSNGRSPAGRVSQHAALNDSYGTNHRAVPLSPGGLSLETPDDLESLSAPAHSASSASSGRRGDRSQPVATRTMESEPETYFAAASPATRPGMNGARTNPFTTPVSAGWTPPERVTPAQPAPAAGIDLAQQQAALQQRLDSIQKMVESLSRGVLTQRSEVPSELFQLYTQLIDSEVEEDLARELICRLKEQGSPDLASHLPLARTKLCSMVEQELRCGGPISVTPGKRRTVALVGPTGVGKTTTLAKLAANFRLRDGIRLGLVTVDTYRIAAVEQLRTYAEIIDLPMKVVTGARDMRRAIDELSHLDLILIDTAGRSPRDELKIQELKNLLTEAEVDEVHLVLSLVSSPKSLLANVEKFQLAKVSSLILTKLDEAAGLGNLVSLMRQVPLPMSYVTMGQDVPDDIEVAQSQRLARLILGEERLNTQRRLTRAA